MTQDLGMQRLPLDLSACSLAAVGGLYFFSWKKIYTLAEEKMSEQIHPSCNSIMT